MATIADAENEVRLVVTDPMNPLARLAEATVALAKGADHVTAEWMIEPGMYRWVLERKDDRLSIRVVDFPKYDSDQPDNQGEPVFTSECRLVEFTDQVLSELRRILEEHGLDGYHALVSWAIWYGLPGVANAGREAPGEPPAGGSPGAGAADR